MKMTNTVTQFHLNYAAKCGSITVISESSPSIVYGRTHIYQHHPFQVRHHYFFCFLF